MPRPPRIGDPLPRAEDAWYTQVKLIDWVLGEKGHADEWRRVFHVEVEDAELIWESIAEAVLEAPITEQRGKGDVVSYGVLFELTINGRVASVLTAGTTGMQAPHRGWSPPIPSPTLEGMATMDDVAIGDVVELTEPADPAPAGARGGITDLLDDGKVIVEVTTLPLEPILDRIVIVPPATLRIIEPAQPQT